MFPVPAIPPNLQPVGVSAGIGKPSPCASGWHKLWSVIYLPEVPLGVRLEIGFAWNPTFAWLHPLPCPASSGSASGAPGLLLLTYCRQRRDLLENKPSSVLHIHFLILETIYREWSDLLSQWDHICKSSLYTVEAIEMWVIITEICNCHNFELGKRNLTCKVYITVSFSQLSTAWEVSISILNPVVLLMPCLAADCIGLGCSFLRVRAARPDV